MELEEPMDVDTSGDFEKFDDMLEEGEYVESNRITRKTLSSVVSVSSSKLKILFLIIMWPFLLLGSRK